MKDTAYVEYRYAHDGHHDPELNARLIDIVGNLSAIVTICDLGCGNGWLANNLATANYRVTGIDVSPSGIEVARRRNTGAAFACDTLDADLARRLELQGEIDLVVSSEVIEHLYRPADLLEAAEGLLKPGGYLLLTTPYHGYLKYLAISLLGRMDQHLNPNWEGGHIKFFSIPTLTALLENQGFEIQRFTYYGRSWALWKSMICLARKAP